MVRGGLHLLEEGGSDSEAQRSVPAGVSPAVPGGCINMSLGPDGASPGGLASVTCLLAL